MTTECQAVTVACVQEDDKLRVRMHTLQQNHSCPRVERHLGGVRRTPPGIITTVEPNFTVFLAEEDLSSYLGGPTCLS